MKIDVDTMSGAAKKVYDVMWRDFDFIDYETDVITIRGNKDFEADEECDEKENLYKPCRSGASSYAFCSKDKPTEEILTDVFKIENRDFFKCKYKLATSGSGDESKKIATLHSSSLACLLFFYKIDENHSIKMTLKTNTRERVEKFTESYYEYKSPVIGYPSNMDVVLCGEEEGSNTSIVLLLESKFSEYYVGVGKASSVISGAYCENKYT